MDKKKPILITGSHRSGSTWVGKMIATSPSVVYIHEPFNVKSPPRIGISKARFNHWFTYICNDNEKPFYSDIKDLTQFKYNLLEEIRDNGRDQKSIKRLIREYFKSIEFRISKKRPLIKDPIAFFSTEWLQSRFNMDVIVLVRHPAAFANSLKRLNWSFNFEHLLEQPLLIRDYLNPFEKEIKTHINQKHTIIEQASLLWKIIHSIIVDYQKKYHNHPNWIFMRHEDLSMNPIMNYQTLFNFLDIEFTELIKENIGKYSSENNPTLGKKVQSLKRNSKANVKAWKNQLSLSEIETIKRKVEEVSCHFYSDSDW